MENAIIVVMTFILLGLAGIPLLRERKPEEDLVVEEDFEDLELERVLSQKETALEAIRELEFDHAVGSLSDEDYAELKEKYERKAISVLKNLRGMGEAGGHGSGQEKGRKMGAARAKRGGRQMAREFACPECGASFRPEARFCASCGVELDVYEDDRSTCLECGEPYEEGDVYCASCGANLEAVEEEFATDGEDITEGFASEKADEAMQPQNPSTNPQRKRPSRRPRSSKKTAGNNGEG